MGILDSVKRAFNISGAVITVAMDDAVYSQNDPVSGQVIITGRELEQSGKSITLELKEFWTESRSNGKTTTTVTVFKTHDTVKLADAFTIKPNSE